MTKVKFLVLLFAVIILMLVFPNIVSATTIEATETTTTSTGKTVNWSYELDSNNNILNLKCTNISSISGELTIPSTIDGYTVITIGYRAFYNCYGLKNITIPESVTSIGDEAFGGCSGLTSLTFPNAGNLTTIGSDGFRDCTGIKNITIPNSVTTIGNFAFYSCTGLKELILSENLTKIPAGAFSNCSGLKSVILPQNVTTICENTNYRSAGAFENCKNLEKILIPDAVATIEKGVFEGCSKLTIYGNDGMTSKEYAEENEINFKYISEWDNSDVGDDITPPTVESTMIPYSNVSDYYDSNSTTYIIPTGKALIINVNFSEDILATEIPTLTIKFGSGENIELTNGTVKGSTIAYTYTIANGNIGTLSVVNISGGNVKDDVGNEATLSCPKLTVQSRNYYIYANGTTQTLDNTQNQDTTNNNDTSKDEKNNEEADNTQTGNNSTNSNNTANANKSETTEDTSKKEDTTVATSKLPNTGLGIGLTVAMIIIIIVGILAYCKYNKLKGI